jgi:hypothetical protein
MPNRSHRVELLRASGDFVRCWPEIEALRRSLAVADDVLLDPAHFLASTDSHRQSCSAACWKDGCLVGLLYATEHCVAGIRTGYAIGGDFIGRGLLLCAAEDEAAVLRSSVQALLASGIHSLHLRLLPRQESRLDVPGARQISLQKTTPGDRMALPPSFDEFLATLGKHTRRNVRNSMRKAAGLGIQFEHSLDPDEYRATVARLNVATVFHADPIRLARDERLLGYHSGGRRCGLRDTDGNLIAVLCGFSRGPRFHLLTQVNDVRRESLSLSVVLRGQLIDSLIASGHNEIQFMGGTSLTFGRFCKPLNYQSVYIDKRFGISAVVKRAANALVKFSALTGAPVPEKVAMMCSGHLNRSRLIERTALGIGGYQNPPEQP